MGVVEGEGEGGKEKKKGWRGTETQLQSLSCLVFWVETKLQTFRSKVEV